MMRVFARFVLGGSLVIFFLIGLPAIAQAQPDPAELAKAVEAIENLDAMRSGLAAYLEDAPEAPIAETMKQVCKPVGMKALQLSQENGWQVKQMATKYRNPAHAPDNLHARMALAKFEQDPDLTGFWEPETLDGQTGTRYYRRINVEASCLACHGAQNNRPQFVQDNYPQDLAYDFNVGDLRGMYAVFIPDVKPLPVPAVATSSEERDLLQTQQAFMAVKSLAKQAKVTFVGISHIAWNSPLHEDGFINDEELTELIDLGAIGEIAGWVFDVQGNVLHKGSNTRVASVPPEQPAQKSTIGVAGGIGKAEAIRAALRGQLITGLITDEAAAEAILEKG